MNSKNLKFVSIVLSALFLSSILMSFTANYAIIPPNNVPSTSIDEDGQNADLNRKPLSSDTCNNDSLTMAEKAAQILYAKWEDNKWNESGTIYLGQRGVAGIGEVFIDLYRETSNETYREWAIEVGNWLNDTKNDEFSNYRNSNGKWPDRINGNIQNYTGYQQGAAGIGSFYINLYNITQTESYKSLAVHVHEYISEINQSAGEGNGAAWIEKEPTILTNSYGTVSSRKIYEGDEALETKLSNLFEYNSSTYDIISNESENTDVVYSLDLSDAGVPVDDIFFAHQFLSLLKINLSISSNVSLDSSGIYIQATNGTDVPIQENSTDTSEQEFGKAINSDFDEFLDRGRINIRVFGKNTSADHTMQINSMNISVSYNNEYNSTSFSTGAAGVGKFYLDMHQYSGEDYINEASEAGDFILYKEQIVNGTGAWLEKGEYGLSRETGALGIARFLLDLSLIKAEEGEDYENAAKRAANWLIESGDIEGTKLRFPETNRTTSQVYTTGISFNAGIGNLLLDLGNLLSNDNYLRNSSLSANWLTSSDIVKKEEAYGLSGNPDDNIYYRWSESQDEESVNYFYSRGGSGALEFLDNFFFENASNPYGDYVSGGIEWLINNLNLTEQFWHGGSNRRYNVPNGLAGIISALLTIDIKRPEISANLVPKEYEYNEPYQVLFEINNYSNIDSEDVQIFYRYGEERASDYLDSYGDNLYNYTFEPRTWGQTYFYTILAQDQNNTFSYDNNNSQEYRLDIVDTEPLDTSVEKLFGEGLGQEMSGKVRIKVEKEHNRGADLNYVEVNIPQLGISDPIQGSQFTENTYLSYDYQIDVGTEVDYGENVEIKVISHDEANNTFQAEETFKVIDNVAPICNVEKDFKDADSQWIPQFTAVELKARVYDEGSGLDDEKGVFILYTTDEGANWNKVFLERESENTFSGEIPGQVFLGNIYYVLGAEDKMGNYRIWNKFGDSYNDIGDIDVEDDAWRYGVTVNVWAILIFIAIVGGIGVVAYLVYSRKGDYLDQMRRKSKATATGLAVKERLTKFYYWATEKMDNFGRRLVESKESFYSARIWFEDHVGERAASVLKTIGRVLWAVPLGIAHGIGYFFKGIGRMIVNSKAWQLILYIVFGLTILLTTVVQFVMAGRYPLRAVFFTNLGFGMFISGIIIFLIRFIYKLAYK